MEGEGMGIRNFLKFNPQKKKTAWFFGFPSLQLRWQFCQEKNHDEKWCFLYLTDIMGLGEVLLMEGIQLMS